MQLLRGRRSDRLDQLITVAIVLGGLMVVLVTWSLLGDVLGILDRFQHEIYLFVFGALIAYLLVPLVNLVQRATRRRWAAIAGSYLLLFLALVLVGVLLLNPIVSQVQSLVTNLHDPTPANLQGLQKVRSSTRSIETALQNEQQMATRGRWVSQHSQKETQEQILALQRHLLALSMTTPPREEIQIPPSYVRPIQASVQKMATAYETAVRSSGPARQQALDTSVTDARAAVSAANMSYDQVATTPLLLLDAQVRLDNLGLHLNLHNMFGTALQQLSKQLSSILSNLLGVVVQAGSFLLNAVLVLIISVYFVADGGRLVDWLIGLTPTLARSRVRSVVSSLDSILGTFLRTQVLLAALAGGLDAGGAFVFGVPYAIVIFVSCFLMSLIPVIGPVILPFPPMILALVFTPLPAPLFYLLWLVIAEQLVTNVVGPRVQGHQEGIPPLEAMAAALLGFPIAGFVGAFFAVPVVSFLHLVVQQVIRSTSHEGDEPAAMQSSDVRSSSGSRAAG